MHERFLLTSCKPYVQTLILHDNCPDQRTEEEMARPYGRPLYYTKDRTVCGAWPGGPVAERLRELPALRSLTIYKKDWVAHGLPWDTLRAVLSVPHLREFKLRDLYLCPVLQPGDELNFEALAPLTSFQYRLRRALEPLASSSSEMAALYAVLGKLCETLETLDLVSERAPLADLSQLRWPRLRKLVYCGVPWSTLSAPWISLHPGMDHLRSLSLKLDLTPGGISQMLWPADYAGPFPWPMLEHLLVSFPDPRDEVYDHLPSSLRALSLRCYPHLHVQRRPSAYGANPADDYPDHPALSSAASILSILRRCNMLDLDHLEIEYRADGEEDALLRQIAAMFPRLTSLKFHRYRSAQERQGKVDVSVEHIAEMLAPLSHLYRLKIYLEFAGTPRLQTSMMGRQMSEVWTYDEGAICAFEGTVRAAVGVLARVLSSSLREVVMYSVSEDGPYWRVYDIAAGCPYERRDRYTSPQQENNNGAKMRRARSTLGTR
ncbi:hypothetical protein EVJ58_g1093 [Rhodofomes roseus]|uniref:F-box domain-containing protein n=1 Tax=Rhodofomes roseus TaxID=34475 RepID=A0A4Y9Z2Q1_9APHY|nr:hypothetical protein EVJ58_g1093 [Rhodofomes roseus]